MLELSKDVKYIKGVGPSRVVLLNKLGIFTLQDLITYFPRAYQDRGKPRQIAALQDGDEALIEAVCISKMGVIRIRKNMTIYKLIVRDETGTCTITWFNMPYLRNKFTLGETYKFYGKVKNKFGKIDMLSPVFDEESTSKNTGKIIPIYPTTYDLSQNVIRQIIENGLKEVTENLEETLPNYILEKYEIEDINTAIRQIHFPSDFDEYNKARKRLVFEELLIMQLALLNFKNKYTIETNGIKFKKDVKMSDIINKLPYKLTNAQIRVLEEIDKNMESNKSMNRLLQGDVGSRKNYSINNCSL